MKTGSFPVRLALTIYSHSRSTLSNEISEQRTSKLLSKIYGHLWNLWSTYLLSENPDTYVAFLFWQATESINVMNQALHDIFQ